MMHAADADDHAARRHSTSTVGSFDCRPVPDLSTGIKYRAFLDTVSLKYSFS